MSSIYVIFQAENQLKNHLRHFQTDDFKFLHTNAIFEQLPMFLKLAVFPQYACPFVHCQISMSDSVFFKI